MARRADRYPLRSFVHVSDPELAGFLDQIDYRTRQSILAKLPATLGFGFGPGCRQCAAPARSPRSSTRTRG
jgi:hypothetical protein